MKITPGRTAPCSQRKCWRCGNGCSSKHTPTSQQVSESKQRSISDFCTPLPFPTVPLPVSLRVSLVSSINSGRESEGQQELASLPSAQLMNRHSGTFSIRLCPECFCFQVFLLLHRAAVAALLSKLFSLCLSFSLLSHKHTLHSGALFLGFSGFACALILRSGE